MTHPIIKTDNYILITSDEEIKAGDWYLDTTIDVVFKNDKMFLNGVGYKKVIAHLPLNNSSILEGVPLLPPFEEIKYDFAEMFYNLLKATYTDFDEWVEAKEYKKAKEKYKFTEDDVIKIVEKSRETGLTAEFLMLSLSQPKLPVGFKCEMERIEVNYSNGFLINTMSHPKIINGVMQGEWIENN